MQFVVQPGDTLWLISSRFGVSIQEIVNANQLIDPTTLFIGQILNIPIIFHTVQAGDTLWSIAFRYGVTVTAVVQANRIQNPGFIHVGQRLRIPEEPKKAIEVNAAYVTQMGQAGANLVLSRQSHQISPISVHLVIVLQRLRALPH